MERSSDKHGSRLDEELKRELSSLVKGSPVESRAAEAREQESHFVAAKGFNRKTHDLAESEFRSELGYGSADLHGN